MSPRESASVAHASKSEDHAGTDPPVTISRVRYGSPWVMKPEPMTSTPSCRNARRRRPRSIRAAGSWVGMLSCSTGTSANGYITLSGTHEPWSRPRLVGAAQGDVPVGRRPRAAAEHPDPGPGGPVGPRPRPGAVGEGGGPVL